MVGPRGPEYRRDDQAGTIRWYCYDGLGSVLGEVAPDGTLTRAQSYDVYGLVRTSAGQATTRHKFVGSLGHPSEDETGLVYMRARYYDPVTGRFASEDPARHGGNWFSYCDSNPASRIDPSGCAWLSDSAIEYLRYALQFIGGLSARDLRILQGGGKSAIQAWLHTKMRMLNASAAANLEMGLNATAAAYWTEAEDEGMGLEASQFTQAQSFLARAAHNAFASEGLEVIFWLMDESVGFMI